MTEADGTQHRVCYTSQEQNDQIIVLADPNRLSVTLPAASLAVAAEGRVNVPVHISRGRGLDGPVRVQLVVPRHIKKVRGEAITIAAGQLPIQFFAGPGGPFNMPVTVRATTDDERGYPAIDEAPLVLVEPER